jgi:uncharacterized protein Yka (UPF0111/DUF47 family)
MDTEKDNCTRGDRPSKTINKEKNSGLKFPFLRSDIQELMKME